ncbi:MAG: SulP family inorganic anion transporter [Gammaproteobacteria bacterium]|nr:MAG: SulP family inorganic anion transporter [Gammaproteobacteria bacterium]TLZ09558.1 MAG: SulP family inorganic anion transporter [Gammaproteobacteria bacterium]TLZ11848.1 MAG: SulP family inorganic anion transporter [Gammaproteobacteria bacterium]TLZ17639.1 MAG: SulP family inorganic anion transporter [Gammaproteobacteria bacterium]TLZ25654.1 MAG: SulP family inorganic anion transporter [Gammaproteobacteria bacterium]
MRTRTAGADLLAGLSIAGLLLPEAVAYSGVASLPPQAGVIALFAGLLCYGLIGRSRVAIVTATSSSAAVLASATLTLGGGDLALRLALASILVAGAGAAFVLAAALRLGALSHLIARPVLRGYAFGLALVIAVKQWPHLVNLHTQATGFFPLVAEILRAHPSWHWPSLACGLAALAGLMVLERVPRMPGALTVIVGSILASSWLNAQGVALTGPIHLALGMPALALPAGVDWLPLAEFSLALMLILFAESYGSIRSFALKRDEEVQPNRDLLALGVANILCGLLQGTPVGAGYSATSANAAAGARSALAGLYAGAVVLTLVLLFLRWVERIPEPALAAIVIHAVSKALRPGVFADYFRWQRDRMLVVAAVLTVMIFGVLNGLLAGIAFSLALLLKSLASPRLSVLGRVGAHDYVSLARFAHAVSTPGVLIVRPEQPLFFANAEPLLAQVRQRALAAPDWKLVILSLEESPDLDSTTLEALEEFCSWLAARGVQFRVARLKELAREALLRAKLAHLPASALDYSSVDDAVRGEGVSPTQQA